MKDDLTLANAFLFCESFQNKAIAIKSGQKVGCLIRGENNLGFENFGGCNIEVSTGIAYHAEEVALLNCLSSNFRPVKLYVTSSSKEECQVLCLRCRYIFWKVAPNLEIIVFNPNGTLKMKKKLSEIVPFVEEAKERIHWDDLWS